MPLSIDNSDCVKSPRIENRSPQTAGGVASKRNSCLFKGLRDTKSTWLNVNGGGTPKAPLGISSTQCTTPLRMANSGCEKNQSAPPVLLSSLEKSKPAMVNFPCTSRRIFNSGDSIKICSTFNCSKDAGDTDARIRGNFKASRPAASNKATSLSSNEGIMPTDLAEISPILTGIPSTKLASISNRGRSSPIRGTITQCSAIQANAKITHAAIAKPSSSLLSAAVMVQSLRVDAWA